MASGASGVVVEHGVSIISEQLSDLRISSHLNLTADPHHL